MPFPTGAFAAYQVMRSQTPQHGLSKIGKTIRSLPENPCQNPKIPENDEQQVAESSIEL